MRMLALILAVAPGLALASTGGDQYVTGLCLEAGGKRILYGHGDHSESGNSDALMALDLATGKTTELIADAPESEQPSAEPFVKGCTPLKPARLADVGLSAEVQLAKPLPAIDSAPEDPFLFRPMHPYLLVLSAGGRPLRTQSFNACYGRDSPAKLRAYHLPGHRFVALA